MDSSVLKIMEWARTDKPMDEYCKAQHVKLTADIPQTDMAEDIVESLGFNAESYRQAKAKTEPQTDCDSCKHNKLEWYSDECDSCCKVHSNYEPKQTDCGWK